MKVSQQQMTTKLKTLATKLFMAFVILQPIFDIYMSLFDEKIQIVGTSLATILRFLMVFVITVMAVIIARKRKITLVFAVYAFLILIYTVIHHFNAIGFSVELRYSDYNLLNELIYIARMCLPPALIYVIYILKPQYKDIKICILSVSVIISSVIIISNLFKFGYVAYDLGKTTVADNMISWFTSTSNNWSVLTCRGLFQWANQLSGVMLITLPFVTYVCLKESKPLYWFFSVMHIVAMINLGTRIAAIGGPLVFMGIIGLHILEKIIHKGSFKKQIKNGVCILLSVSVLLIIFLNSPMIIRGGEAPLFSDIISTKPHSSDGTSSKNDSSEKEDITDKEEYSAEKNEKIKFIEENLPTARIHEFYTDEVYPYEEDYEFWYDLIKNVPNSEYYGNRNIRNFLIKRILERDGRFSNYIWGISYTRSSSFVWPERDIETHFDSMGIVGVILFLGPYFLAAILGIWCFFKRFLENTHLSKCVYIIALGLGVLNAYYSGHIMNEIFPFVFLSLMSGMTINTALDSKKTEE